MFNHANNRNIYGHPLSVHLLNATPRRRGRRWLLDLLTNLSLVVAGTMILLALFLFLTP